MEYTKLNKTDIRVSRICMGTMTFGEQNTEEDAHEQLDYAVDQGVNFLDTAEMYPVPGKKETQGRTEKYIGSWLKKRGRRDDLVIASKATGPTNTMSYVRNNVTFQPEGIREAIEGNLQRLGTDYIDLYQLHWPERRTNNFGDMEYHPLPDEDWTYNLDQVTETLNALQKEGKIRHWGLSNEAPWGVMRYLHEAEKHNMEGPVTIQNPFSLLNRMYKVGLSEITDREDVGLLAYSPLAFGQLSGKYLNGNRPEGARLTLYPVFSRYRSEKALKATSAYKEIAEKHGMSVAQLALAFVHQQHFVTSTIIGATKMEQLKENIDSINIKLSDDILEEIEAVHEEIPNPTP